ncbi:MAG: FHA domain-containing protein, partial [Paracoccaceae bacterium]
SRDPGAEMHSATPAKIVAIPKATDGMATEHKVATPKPSAEVGASVTVVASVIEQVPKSSIPDVQAEPDSDSQTDPETIEAKPSPAPNIVHVPAPAAGRAGRRAGRVKTRLLGFEHSHSANSDPFDVSKEMANGAQVKFPVGWIVVVSGPGRGNTFALFNGVAQIGRGEDQAIKLDFGDTSISRSNHAAIAYDNEQRAFFLGHGGKANLVRLNDKPVLSTEEISSSDLIRIGETTLRFVGLCGTDFDWGSEDRKELDDAAIA